MKLHRRHFVLLSFSYAVFPRSHATAVEQPPESRTSVFAGDERLSRGVLIQAEGLPVGELLGLLTDRTGVDLTVASDTSDEKVIVFTPSRPLRDTLVDLAVLLNARWRTEKTSDGKSRYRLDRDPRAERYEEQLAREPETKWRAVIEEQVRALKESPEELAKRPVEDPIRRQLSGPASRKGTELYALLSPAQKDALFANQSLRIPFRDFPPQQQTLLRQAMRADHQRAGYELSELEPDLQAMEKRGVAFRFVRQGGHYDVSIYLSVASNLPIATRDDEDRWLLPVRGNPYTRETVAKSAAFPEQEVIRRAAAKAELFDRLRLLCEQSGLPVFCDYYRFFVGTRRFDRDRNAQTSPTPTSTANAAEYLDVFAAKDGLLWWAEGKTLYFRHRDWYARRPVEPPDRWVRATAERLRKQNAIPTYRDVVACRELSPAQLQALSDSVRTYPSYFPDENAGLTELLEIFCLSPRTQTAAPLSNRNTAIAERTESPISFSDMNEVQQLLVAQFFQKRQAQEYSRDLRSFSLKVSYTRPPLPEGSEVPPFVVIYVEWSRENADINLSGMPSHSVPLPFGNYVDRRSRTRAEVSP